METSQTLKFDINNQNRQKEAYRKLSYTIFESVYKKRYGEWKNHKVRIFPVIVS